MTFCTNCGQQVDGSSKFCSNCGTPIKQNIFNTERKTIYDGTMHKCPNCGVMLKSFITNCPTCGFEFRDTKGVSQVTALAKELEKIEANRSKGKGFLAEMGQLEAVDKQKIDLIKNFPIPNTKEDIIEFVVFAASNIEESIYNVYSGSVNITTRRALSDTWLSKLEYAVLKADIMLSSEERAIIRNIYNEKLKNIQKSKMRQAKVVAVLFGLLIGIPLLIFLLLHLFK